MKGIYTANIDNLFCVWYNEAEGGVFMKNTKRIIAIFLCVLLTIAFATVAAIHFGSKKTANRNRVEDVTIIQLLATPEKYDGKRIRVVGVGNLEFEGNALYLSKDDLFYRVYNAVWLDFDNNTSLSYEEAIQFNGNYVCVEGTFQKDKNGHGSLFHGTITDITRYDLKNRK